MLNTKNNTLLYVFLVGLLASCSSSDEVTILKTGDSFDKDGVSFCVLQNSDNGKTVEAVSCVGGDVVIPSMVAYGGTDYLVESVDLRKAEQPVTSLTISEGISNVSTIVGNENLCKIRRVALPGSMEYVDNQLAYCPELEEVYLSEGIKRLDGEAFMNARLRELHIPASLTEIGSGGNYGTSDRPGAIYLYVDCLEKIDVASDNPVFGCGDKSNVLIHKPSKGLMTGNSSGYIPKEVKTVFKYAFRWSDQYDKEVVIDIPDGVETIEGWAFEAPRISSITIPASVQDVLGYAFRGDGLKSVKIADGSEELRFHDQYNMPVRCLIPYSEIYDWDLDEVYVGRNTELFVLNAFEPSSSMKLGTLTIGPMVKSLNWNTYEEWTNKWTVTSVVSYIGDPALVDPLFPESVFNDAVLYVPQDIKESYMVSSWNRFAQIKELP